LAPAAFAKPSHRSGKTCGALAAGIRFLACASAM
jgi:hypothetical protein